MILHFAPALAHLAIKFIAQDRKQPGLYVGAGLERILLGPRFHDRVLDEIIRAVGIADQRYCECAQLRQDRKSVV